MTALTALTAQAALTALTAQAALTALTARAAVTTGAWPRCGGCRGVSRRSRANT